MSNYCTIYLVRHGETDWNKKRVLQGHTNIPLNGVGIQQAKNIKNILGHIKFDAFFSSDLLRAKQTAEIMALNYQLIVQTTKILRERRYGNFEGKSFAKINKFRKTLEKIAKGNKALHDKYYRQEGMETDEEIALRITTFLREIAVIYPCRTVFIASHGGVMRVILSLLTGKKYKSGDIDNAAYLKIDCDGIDFFLKKMTGVKNK